MPSKNPDIATFHFRGKNTWLGGDHNRSTIKEFYGACEEHRTASTPFVIDNGEPPVLLGQDKGANPVEHLLNALMGCMTTTMAYHAASRGIEIKRSMTRATSTCAVSSASPTRSARVSKHSRADAGQVVSEAETLRELATFSLSTTSCRTRCH